MCMCFAMSIRYNIQYYTHEFINVRFINYSETCENRIKKITKKNILKIYL